MIGEIIANITEIPYTIFDESMLPPPENGICTSTLTAQECGDKPSISTALGSTRSYMWKSGGLCGLTRPDPRCRRRRLTGEMSVKELFPKREVEYEYTKEDWMTEEQVDRFETSVAELEETVDANDVGKLPMPHGNMNDEY
jgi:hypothetical protein